MRARATMAVLAATGATALSLLAPAGSAIADPATPLAATDIAGVGSETTQYVMDAYSIAYNKTSPPNKLGSWDAFNPTTGLPGDQITTKTGCAPITRPNGGSAGVAALQADTTGCVDFARTITPKATDGSQNNLAFFAFARDGVTWAAVPSANTASSLTTAQLTGIYNCTLTNWNQISASLPSNSIHAYLPQIGSALRKNFLTRIGLTDSSVGACVHQNVEQNKGNVLAGDTLALVPHSIASWIAQTNGTQTDFRGGVTLHQVNGLNPTVLTSTGKYKLNKKFDANFLYLAYNVVKLSGGSVPSKYLPVFSSTGYICAHQSTLTKYGFGTLGSACGTQT